MKFNADVIRYLENTESIRVVVISSPFKQYLKPVDGKHHWLGMRQVDGGFIKQEPSIENAVSAMTETIERIRSLGREVVIVAPPPSGGFNIGTCTERRAQGKIVYGAPSEDCTIPLDLYKNIYALTLDLLRRIVDETGVTVVYFDPVICDENRCSNTIDGIPIYVDNGHLTHDASVFLMRRLKIDDLIYRIIGEPR